MVVSKALPVRLGHLDRKVKRVPKDLLDHLGRLVRLDRKGKWAPKVLQVLRDPPDHRAPLDPRETQQPRTMQSRGWATAFALRKRCLGWPIVTDPLKSIQPIGICRKTSCQSSNSGGIILPDPIQKASFQLSWFNCSTALVKDHRHRHDHAIDEERLVGLGGVSHDVCRVTVSALVIGRVIS